MAMPDKAQIRVAVYDIAVCIAVEAVLARVARRLKNGRPCPDCGAKGIRRRPVRRLAGAVLHELGAESATEMYLRRLRMRTAVDRMIENQGAQARRRGHAHIPAQRHAPDELFTGANATSTPSGT